jgi:iron complex outermembrane recepter protein
MKVFESFVPQVGFLLILTFTFTLLPAQPASGRIEGTVVIEQTGRPVHHASVLIVQLGRAVETDHDGSFSFENVPPGVYDLVAHLASLASRIHTVRLSAGDAVQLDFTLGFSPVKHEITVTASPGGREGTTFDAFQTIVSMDSFDLSENMATSIGEVLQRKPGIAKRSFGPGTARPIIRGFDGDRVLVLQDGIRTGSLGSQSGDHGEPIDPMTLDRLEVVKGPAALLYGSNAIGGVVNTIGRHSRAHVHPHQGLSGTISGVAGSNNAHGGGGVSVEYGEGNWLIWGAGSGQRTGDYNSPIGEVENSKSRISSGNAGFGWFGNRGFFTFDYDVNDGRYGIPFAGEFHGHGHDNDNDDGNDHDNDEDEELIDLTFRRHNVRWSGGFQNLGKFIDRIRLSLNYTDWNHRELEIEPDGREEVGTQFENKQLIYRGVFEQQRRGIHSGSFGFWGMVRDYEATGIEALAPPVDQKGIAFFGLQELAMERFKLQLGARVEHNRYTPTGLVERREHDHDHEHDNDDDNDLELVLLPKRNFTTFSGGAGLHVPLGPGTAFVTNFNHASRAPALEELYNFGPHVGNLAFEIGNPDLKRETSNGVDFSLRHVGDRVRAEANFFYYRINDFVFLAPTGDIEDGLIEAEFLQDDSRFTGTELGLDLGMAPGLWLNLGMDLVDAELRDTGTPLPRIPPLRGRVGFDARYNGLSVRPQVVIARQQSSLFPTETRTPGYAVVDLTGSYTLPQDHFIHHFSVNVFNIGDRLYRNHSSFIKDLAPEIGRGVKFSYTLKFF